MPTPLRIDVQLVYPPVVKDQECDREVITVDQPQVTVRNDDGCEPLSGSSSVCTGAGIAGIEA